MGIAILLSASIVQANDAPVQDGPLSLDLQPGPMTHTSQGNPSSLADTLTLQEVTVRATFSDVSNTPLRLKTIDSETLKSRAAGFRGCIESGNSFEKFGICTSGST